MELKKKKKIQEHKISLNMYAFVVSHIVCKPMDLNSAIDTHRCKKLYTFLYDVTPRVPETEKCFVELLLRLSFCQPGKTCINKSEVRGSYIFNYMYELKPLLMVTIYSYPVALKS